MKLRISLIVMCLLAMAVSVSATTRKVLFIGNSYTYTNAMPTMLQSFAAAQGDTLIFDQSDPGGYAFAQHCAYAPTLSLIFSQQWDVVVLQDQSEEPAFPPAQVETDVYPYARKLDSLIHANDSCTQTMFMMTWGHANGDPPNCPSYPVICTYEGMQNRLRESYMQMTQDNHAVVAPVGAAWKVCRDSFPALWLYQADSVHPIIPGSYLQTCVLYASIFHKPGYGCSYMDGLSVSDANKLQHIADKVTLDSLSQWQQHGHYPYAGFNYSVTGNTVSFNENEAINTEHYWVFGDGAHDTAATGTHSYAQSGTYMITHTAMNECFKETFKDTVQIGPVGVNNVAGVTYPVQVAQNGNEISLATPQGVYDAVDVYSIDGRKQGHYEFSNSKVVLHVIPGTYIYKAFSRQKNISTAGKFATY